MAGDKAASAVTSALPSVAKSLAGAMGKKVLSSATQRLGDTTQRLTDFAANGGGPGGLLGAVTGRGGGGSAKDKSLKVTNILEYIDVGAPLRLVYDQWTRFTDFPNFMKKVESVEQVEDDQLEWKAQVLWSHRTWKSTIVEQVPDKRIVWESEGEKGSVDGAVTFHEIGPDLTRIVLSLQYHPQGFFERTGNIWRAPGRRARLELKHFARQVMNDAILHPDDVQGWRGEIHDGEVTAPEDVEAEREEHRQEQGDHHDGGRPRDRGPRPEAREREPRRSRPGPESRQPRDEEAGSRRRRPSEDGRRPARSGRDR